MPSLKQLPPHCLYCKRAEEQEEDRGEDEQQREGHFHRRLHGELLRTMEPPRSVFLRLYPQRPAKPGPELIALDDRIDERSDLRHTDTSCHVGQRQLAGFSHLEFLQKIKQLFTEYALF